jgi:hypothetical protein
MSNNTLFYQTDFEYDVETLQKAAVGSYFLWMSRSSGTHLFNEYDAHIKDTDAHTTWQYYTDSQRYGVKAFAVEVLDNENGRPIGNIYELHYNMHSEDVRLISFNAKSVAITFKPTHRKEKYTREFEPAEYINRWSGILDRYGEAESVRHILGAKDDKHLQAILADFRARRRAETLPATIEEYVKDMVKARFHGYGYTRDDMVFTTPEDASMALKHQIPVYILNPDNTAKKVQSENDIANATYDERIFGMGSQEKRLLNFFKAGNTFDDLPFSRSDLKTIFFMAMERGKETFEDEQQQKAIDSIIKVTEMILFAGGGEQTGGTKNA